MGLPLSCPAFPEPPLLLASPGADPGGSLQNPRASGAPRRPQKVGLSVTGTPKSPDGRQLPTCHSEKAGPLELDGTHRPSACPNPTVCGARTPGRPHGRKEEEATGPKDQPSAQESRAGGREGPPRGSSTVCQQLHRQCHH